METLEEVIRQRDWYRDRVVWLHMEEAVPTAHQGKAGESEINEPVTAEMVNDLIVGLAAANVGLARIVALTSPEGFPDAYRT